jgi:CIC family chloride channel protein
MKWAGAVWRWLDARASAKWILLSVLVGIVAGLGAITFQLLTQAVLYTALHKVAGFEPRETQGDHLFFSMDEKPLSPVLLIVVLAAGGLASGFLVYTFAPEAEGHGTDAAIDSFHRRRGHIRTRIPIIKTLASAITIGTGGSGGREGPIAQIGAGFGSALATWLKLPVRDRRILLAAGMGAGVGAIFRTPLAGAIFATEILYSDSDFEADNLIPAAIASIVAFTVYTHSLPEEIRYVPLFGPDLNYPGVSLTELLPFVVLSVILAIAGAVYVKVFWGLHRGFQKLPIPRILRPMIGAAASGGCALAIYYAFGRNEQALAVLGTGYSTLQDALTKSAELGVPLLLAIAAMKMVTTGLTIGSGGSGGVFGPSMVIGGCLGAAVGVLLHKLWPDVVRHPESFAIVGMAGFFSGIARAPISTIIMVREMTGGYRLLLPTMLVSALCFLLLRGRTLYIKQVPTRLDSPAHRGDFIVDVLEGLKVGDVYRPSRTTVTVNENASLDEIVHKLASTTQNDFPVVDKEGCIVGIFSASDVRAYLFDDVLWRLANARDVMTAEVVTLSPTDDLNTALKRFTALNHDELPVIDGNGTGTLLGMLRRREVIAAYNQRLAAFKASDDDESVRLAAKGRQPTE